MPNIAGSKKSLKGYLKKIRSDGGPVKKRFTEQVKSFFNEVADAIEQGIIDETTFSQYPDIMLKELRQILETLSGNRLNSIERAVLCQALRTVVADEFVNAYDTYLGL